MDRNFNPFGISNKQAYISGNVPELRCGERLGFSLTQVSLWGTEEGLGPKRLL